MKKLFFVLLFLSFGFNIHCQLLNPGETVKTELDILKNLIADQALAPNIAGRLYNHKKNIHITNFSAFTKELKQYQIDFKNKKTLLIFWEQRDKFSKLLLPALEKTREKYKASELQIFLINTNDIATKDTLVEFLNKYNHTECIFHPKTNQYYEKFSKDYYKALTIPILFASRKSKELYGVTAFPATILVDEKGLVYTAMIGYWAEYNEWLDDMIIRMDMSTDDN